MQSLAHRDNKFVCIAQEFENSIHSTQQSTITCTSVFGSIDVLPMLHTWLLHVWYEYFQVHNRLFGYDNSMSIFPIHYLHC